MKTLWWFILCFIVVSICVLLTGLIKEDLVTIATGSVLTGLSVIAMRGVDGYINTGVWFG